MMGKSMNMNNLTPEEAQQILQVIQKDFELRQKEKERLSKIEEVVNEEETKTEVLTKQKRFNQNCCIRCCQTFGFIFNRRTTCQICKLQVCKSCCLYDDKNKAYNCKACLTHGELKQKSCDWFYDHVSARFKRFGSAKVVRTLYKQADSDRSKFHWSDGDEAIAEEPTGLSDLEHFHSADNESDSGYDPSLYSSFGQSGSMRPKSRPSLQSVFPEIHISDENGQELDNGLIPPPLMAPLSPTNTNNPYQSPDTSLENIQMSPQTTPTSAGPRMLTTPTQTSGDLDNNQNVDKKDIYKEAFENSKRTEEAKFKIRFDNLLTDMQQSFENISPRDGRVPSGYGTTSYGDLMTTYRQRVKDMLVSLSQRLELTVESFDESCAMNPSLTSQKVRQIINKLVEDRLGETLDLTSDEAVSDLSSLSDDSCEQKSYEEQIAQAVIGRVLELHRNQTGITLNLDEPMDQRQSDSSGVEDKLVDKTIDSSVGDDNVIDTADKGIGTSGKHMVDTGVATDTDFDKAKTALMSTGVETDQDFVKPRTTSVSTGVETDDIEGDNITSKKSNRTKSGANSRKGDKRAGRNSNTTDGFEHDMDEDDEEEDVYSDEDDDDDDEGQRKRGDRSKRSRKHTYRIPNSADDEEGDDEVISANKSDTVKKSRRRSDRKSNAADDFDDDNAGEEPSKVKGGVDRKGRRRLDRNSNTADDLEDDYEDNEQTSVNKSGTSRKGRRRSDRNSNTTEDIQDEFEGEDIDTNKSGPIKPPRKSRNVQTNSSNQSNGYDKSRRVSSEGHEGEDDVDGYSDSGDNSVIDNDEEEVEEYLDEDLPKVKHKSKGRARSLPDDSTPKTKSKDSKRTSSDSSEKGAQSEKSNNQRRRRSDTDNGEQIEVKADEKQLLQQEFERLRTFARDVNPRPLYEARYDEEPDAEEVEEEIEAVSVDHDESQEEFASRIFTFDKVTSQDGRYLPDFSEQDEEYNFSFEEVDPDLLSMNLCPILEETEEELEDDKQDVTQYEQDWKGNWIFAGAGGINPYSSLTQSKGKVEFGDVNIMVPEPNEDWSPQVGNENIDDVSDLSENEDRDSDDLSDEEHSFYSKTSEEIARITRKSDRTSLFNASARTDTESDADSIVSRPQSSSFSDTGARNLEASSFASRVSEKPQVKLSEDLVSSETGDPKFEIPPMSVTVPEGEPAKVTCRVSGTQPMDVFWYKVTGEELEELENSENYELAKDGSRQHLTVYNMRSDDGKQYMCMLMNEKGKCCQYFILNTKKNTQELKAPEFLKSPVDVDVTEGQSVKFRCKVKGYPQPRVIWYKDGQILLNQLNYKFERFGNRDYILAIETATMDEDAEYSVLAKNIAGEARASAQLIVEPKNKPESVSKPKANTTAKKSEDKEEEKPKSDLLDLSYLRKGRAPSSSVGKKAKSTSEKKEEQNLSNLGKKMTMTKDSVTEVAEDMLASTKELSEIDKSIAAMDRLLEDLEGDVSSVVSDLDLDLDPSNDLTCITTLDNYMVLQNAAEKVRTVTSSALDYLDKTDVAAKVRQPMDDFATSTPRSSESDSRPFNPDSDASHIPCDSSEVTMETTKTGVAMDTLDTSEDSHKSEVVFSVTPLTINVDSQKDKTPKPIGSKVRAASDSKSKPESEDKHLSDSNAPSQSEDWFDISDIQETSDVSAEDPQSPRSPSSPSIKVNLGPKRENKAPFERDFYIHNTPQMQRKTPPTSPRQEGQQRAHTEEKIYLAAGNVYNLENKVQSLQDKMRAVQNVQEQDKLENQVARTAAQVAASESRVKDVEKSVDQLKKAQEPKTVGSTKSKQAPKAPQPPTPAPPKEKPEPTFLKGSTSEQDLPESRTEFNDEYGAAELPSVNRLKAMFGGAGGAKSDSSVKRDTRDIPDEPVHSITARSVPKGQLEKLRKTTNDDPHSRVALRPSDQPSNPGRATSLTTGQQIKQTPNAPKQVYQSADYKSDNNAQTNIPVPTQNIVVSSNVRPGADSKGKSKQTMQIHLSTDTTDSAVQSETPTQASKPIKSAVTNLPQTPVQSEAARRGSKTGNDIDTPEERKSPKIKSGAISAMSKFWEKVNKGEAEDTAPEILDYE